MLGRKADTFETYSYLHDPTAYETAYAQGMKTLPKVLVSLALVLLPWTLLSEGAQEDSDAPDPAMLGKLTFTADKEVQPLLPPYESAVISVTIGSTTYRFVVDSGVRITSISRRIVDEQSSLLATAPSISMMDGALYSVKKAVIGSLVLTDFPVMNLPVEQSRLPEGVDGQIGMNLLERIPFELNLKNRTFTLFKKSQPLESPVDLNTFWDHRLVVNGEVGGELAKWTIDTGAVRGALFNPVFYDQLPSSVELRAESKPSASYYWQDSGDPATALIKNASVGNQVFGLLAFRVSRVKPYYRTDYSGLFNTTGILPLAFFQDNILKVDYPRGKISWETSRTRIEMD